MVDLPVQLLGAPSELHPPQLQDQQLQIVNLGLVGRECGVLFNDDGVFLDDERLQRFSIECIQIR